MRETKQTRPELRTAHRRTRRTIIAGCRVLEPNFFRGFFSKEKQDEKHRISTLFSDYGEFSLILNAFAWVFMKRGLVQLVPTKNELRWKTLEASSRVIGVSILVHDQMASATGRFSEYGAVMNHICVDLASWKRRS